MFETNLGDKKMNKTIEVFNKELNSLRTGRANINMLDLIKVDACGQKMPINQIVGLVPLRQDLLVFRFGLKQRKFN